MLRRIDLTYPSRPGGGIRPIYHIALPQPVGRVNRLLTTEVNPPITPNTWNFREGGLLVYEVPAVDFSGDLVYANATAGPLFFSVPLLRNTIAFTVLHTVNVPAGTTPGVMVTMNGKPYQEIQNGLMDGIQLSTMTLRLQAGSSCVLQLFGT